MPDSQVAAVFSHCCWFLGSSGWKMQQLAIQDLRHFSHPSGPVSGTEWGVFRRFLEVAFLIAGPNEGPKYEGMCQKMSKGFEPQSGSRFSFLGFLRKNDLKRGAPHIRWRCCRRKACKQTPSCEARSQAQLGALAFFGARGIRIAFSKGLRLNQEVESCFWAQAEYWPVPRSQTQVG